MAEPGLVSGLIIGEALPSFELLPAVPSASHHLLWYLTVSSAHSVLGTRDPQGCASMISAPKECGVMFMDRVDVGRIHRKQGDETS